MGYTGKDLLLKFIEKESISFNAVFSAVNKYALNYKKSTFRKEALQDGRIEPDDTDICYKFADSIAIKDNTVTFDLVVECTFMAQYKSKHDWEDESETIWLRLSCTMVLKEQLISFSVGNIDEYARKNYDKNTHQATASLIPIISREQYDIEAEIFLKKYYPQALLTPTSIPIEDIAKNIMGLTVIKNQILSEEHTIFGQICFFDGNVKVYDQSQKNYIDFGVNRGTIFIDPQTYFLRNVGCANYTIAHEVFHWERHRIFATIKGLLENTPTVAHRCSTYQNLSISKDIFTEDYMWLEKQANAIAPKILMPKAMIEKKINEFIKKYDYVPNGECFNELKQIIDELAEFFQVSKQAARIRMIELKYDEAAEVYNYDKESAVFANEITDLEAYEQIEQNQELQSILDKELDLFRFVENHFVINSPKYIQYSENGLKLTEYAKENLIACTLEFQHNIEIIYNYKEKGVLFREFAGFNSAAKYVATSNNENVINIALAAEKFHTENEDTKNLSSFTTASSCISHLMSCKKWTGAKFSQITTLSPDLFSKINRKPNKVLELPTLVTILICLGYDASVSRTIIQKAGINMRFDNEEERFYDHLLSNYSGKDIFECNDLIKEINQKNNSNIRLLGSKEYENTKVK